MSICQSKACASDQLGDGCSNMVGARTTPPSRPGPQWTGPWQISTLSTLSALSTVSSVQCGQRAVGSGPAHPCTTTQLHTAPHCYMLLVFTFCFYDRGREFLRDQRFDNSMIRYLLPPALPHHVITSHIYTQTHICVQLFHATVMESCFFCF